MTFNLYAYAKEIQLLFRFEHILYYICTQTVIARGSHEATTF